MRVFNYIVDLFFILGLASCNEVYHGSVDNTQNTYNSDGDPHCNHHIHKFYRQLNCLPVYTPYVKCPTSYNCLTLGNRELDLCYYGGRSYPVGFNLTRGMVDLHTPCVKSCQCVRMYEGARFYCSRLSNQGCTAPEGCRHFSFIEDFECCDSGVTSCNRGKKDNVKCVYGGRSYEEGDRFFPRDDITCTQCICASGFNGTLVEPFCHQFSCVLELWGDTPVMLTRGCIPVYLSDFGCCPVTYRCPKPSDRVIKVQKKTSYLLKTDKKCRFGVLTMGVGDQLSTWMESNAKEVVCECRVPPLASCVRRGFALTDHMRREFARQSFIKQA